MHERTTAQGNEVRLLPCHHTGGLRRIMQRTVRQHRHRNVPPRQCCKTGAVLTERGTPSLELGRVKVIDGQRTERAEDLRRIGLAAFPLVREIIDLALRSAHTHDKALCGRPSDGLDDVRRQALAVGQTATVAVLAQIGVGSEKLV